VYIRWLEHARIEYLTDVTGREVTIGSPEGVVQANIAFAYEKMVFFRDDVAVGVRVARIGTKSLDLAYVVVNETRGERAGCTTLVGFDFVNGTSIAIPAEMRERIAAYEIVPPAGL
jgi:acyl-CoA thioester hydrolase